MQRRPIIILLALLLLALAGLTRLSAANANSDAPAATFAQAQVSALVADRDGVTFSLLVPPAQVTADGVVSVNGLAARTNTPGAPALPYYQTLIAVPPSGDISIEVQAAEQSAQAVAAVRPAPTVLTDENTDLLRVRQLESDLELAFTPDPLIYAATAPYPSQAYELSAPMMLRDLRVVQLTLYPLAYRPADGQLTQTGRFDVQIRFSDGRAVGSRPASDNSDYSAHVLNPQQAPAWRSLPTAASAATTFPVGRDTFRISVTQTGIHEITYADLQAAGMDVANINPNTIQMIYRGAPVSYQFIGNGNNIFESNEAIRFYGWAFDGSRAERQYINDNIYWLWAGGSASRIGNIANAVGGTPAVRWTSVITTEHDYFFQTTLTNLWPQFENEADAWYWDFLTNNITREYTLTLPDPDPTGPSGQVQVELFSRFGHLSNHQVEIALNGLTQARTWSGIRSVNITRPVGAAQLNAGANTLAITTKTPPTPPATVVSDVFYLNRVTVSYPRLFRAVNNQLIFDWQTAGNTRFDVGGFSEGNANNAIVWDISNRLAPRAIALGQGNISGTAGDFSWRFGGSMTGRDRLIATTVANVVNVQPAGIRKYVATSLEPSGNGADWLAITHANFRPQATRLAQHRAAFSQLRTHVVDINEIYNQYGWGFAVPDAIRAYLRHGLLDWQTNLQYVTLIGDATLNPRMLPCQVAAGCLSTWNNTDVNYIITDFAFVDRFLGLVPSDYGFSLLVGNDDLADIMIGRAPVNTATEARDWVDKVIEYETSVRGEEPWTRNLLWLADNADAGGNFCAENQIVRNLYGPRQGYNHIEMCLDDYIEDLGSESAAKAAMRTDMFNYLYQNGASILNYRGHGSIEDWAGNLLRRTDDVQWANFEQPTVILSADCLDGNFAWVGTEALSETFLELDLERGSAAHWSSSGLGYSYEHTVLHREFYRALNAEGRLTIGEAVRFSKTQYLTTNGGHPSEAYSFVLQGDPAMVLPRDSGTAIYIPIVRRGS